MRAGGSRALAALTVAAVIGLVLLNGGAGKERRGRGDSPVGVVDDSPAEVVNMPDRFANVAFKCLGPNGIYSTTSDAPVVVIANDDNCARPHQGGGMAVGW